MVCSTLQQSLRSISWNVVDVLRETFQQVPVKVFVLNNFVFASIAC